MNKYINVAIAGATGYIGLQLIKILLKIFVNITNRGTGELVWSITDPKLDWLKISPIQGEITKIRKLP